MATEVYSKEEITLQDGSQVVLKPLVIGRLRRALDAWKEMEKADGDEAEVFRVLINVAGVSLERELADKVERTKPEGEEQWISDEFREYLEEEALDIETIYKILDVCAGLKGLNDPKLLAAAAAAAMEAQGGTN